MEALWRRGGLDEQGAGLLSAALHRCEFLSRHRRYRNRNLRPSRAPLKNQAHQGTSLFTSAATNQRGFPKGIVHGDRNHNLQTSKAPLKSQAQGASLFTSAASSQRVCPKNSPWEVSLGSTRVGDALMFNRLGLAHAGAAEPHNVEMPDPGAVFSYTKQGIKQIPMTSLSRKKLIKELVKK